MNESLWKNKLNVVIDVPMTKIFLIVIIFSEKIGNITFVPPLVHSVDFWTFREWSIHTSN